MAQTRKRTGNVIAVIAFMLLATSVWAQSSSAKAGPLTGDKNAVNHACRSEAAAAGCGNETVGHGLLKCIHAYKKAHPDFKIGQGCREAMKHLRADRRARKAERMNSPKTPPPSQ